MAMENGPFIGDVPIKASIPSGFSIDMFDYQRVNVRSGIFRVQS